MNRISISQAWSYATSFFSGQGVNHAIALIGVGIIIPLILQFALGGGAALTDPMSFASGGGVMAMGGSMILLGLANYILQTGSFFASWRIGLTHGREPVGAALAYGLIAALPTLLLLIAVVLILVLIAFVLFGSAFTSLAGGNPDPRTAAGAGVFVLLMIPVFFLFCAWLAGRLSCTGPIMADRRSYNILSGMADSWRMTGASQWKLLGYFVLLFIAAMVISMILGAIVGVSVFASGGTPSAGSFVGIAIGGLLLGVPMAYLQVAIPAGIYRALGSTNQSDIFA